jgi:diacylglycerol kinase (ATP)
VRVTLVYNPSAGDEHHSAGALCTLITDAGHRVEYVSLDDSGWEDRLASGTDLVAIAGGDGSIGTVIRELSTGDRPATILPIGSANNIARALGIVDKDLEQLVRGWAQGTREPFYLGGGSSRDKDECFVESTGGGLFAESLLRAEERPDGEDKVDLGLRLLRELVDELPAGRWGVHADGEDCSGAFLAVEAMIVGDTGPNVPLAPDANPGDALLDLVQIGDDERAALGAYLDERLRGNRPKPPRLPVRRVREVTMSPPATSALRMDDAIWPHGGDAVFVSGGRRSVQLLRPFGV